MELELLRQKIDGYRSGKYSLEDLIINKTELESQLSDARKELSQAKQTIEKMNEKPFIEIDKDLAKRAHLEAFKKIEESRIRNVEREGKRRQLYEFAGQALQGILTNQQRIDNIKNTAKGAIALAKELIKQLEAEGT